MKKIFVLFISLSLAGSLSAQVTQKDKNKLRKNLHKEHAAKKEVARDLATGNLAEAKRDAKKVKAYKRAVRRDLKSMKRKHDAAKARAAQ